LAESFNHLVDAHDSGYIPEELLHQLRTQLKEIERMLNGYIHHLRKQKENT
jgi:four helix bundle protein